MRKFTVCLIILCSLAIVTAGTSVAYYNTKKFGFDEDTVLAELDESGITILDFDIRFSDIEDFYEKAKRYVPEKLYNMEFAS